MTAWEQDGVKFDGQGKVQVKQVPTRKAALIRICLCQADGELIFGKDDEAAIVKMDSPIVAHWYEQALIVSGQRREEREDEDVETEGN